MAVSKNNLEAMIKTAFPDAVFLVEDLAGDGNHYRLTIESPAFVGKSRVQQHQMVYNALGPTMGHELHALALSTKQPK